MYRWKLVSLDSSRRWTRRELAEQFGQIHIAGQRDAVLPVGGKDVVLRLARPAGTDLRRFLAGERDPQGQLALALQRGCLHVEAADFGHVGVKAAEFFRVEPGRVLGEHRSVPRVPSGPSSWTMGTAGSPNTLRLRLTLVVHVGSVELGRGQIVWRPYRLLACRIRMRPQSLGYMPDREYIPGPAYIWLTRPLLYPQRAPCGLHVKR